MLSERNAGITFSTLSARAEVSRRTLYTHWGTIENLFADTIFPEGADLETDYGSLPLRERLTVFYSTFSTAVTAEVASGLASLMWASQYDPLSGKSIMSIGSAVRTHFVDRIAPLTDDQYDLLIGPLLLARMTRATVSLTLIATLIDLGVQQLQAVELTVHSERATASR